MWMLREVGLRILLVGNFEPDQQESMTRFCELLRHGLIAAGDAVTVLCPQPIFARVSIGPVAAQKWLGYLDKFVLFPFVLLRRAKSYDVIHICDHSNSMYTRFLLGRPHIVTCHDVLAVRSGLGEIPANPTGWSGRILQREILRGLERAQFIICVSEKTKQDLLRLTHRDPEHISCVYNGLNHPYLPMEAVEAWGRVRSLLELQSACDQWYKNRPGVLEIFASLRARAEFRNHRLVMAGMPFTSETRALIASHHLYADVVELESVPNEDLTALYSVAEGLVFPSLEEGFGWPIVEAQACGCPVFTSNRPPMNEIGGDAAVYFDPSDPIGAAAIVAESMGRRSVMVEKGIANAKRFEAEKMLGQYREVYARVAEDSQLSLCGRLQSNSR
jgi:glycosyltransferase involved in cell wall biosynthesis